MTVSITKNPNGSITCSTVEANRRLSRTYYGYTREQATRMFRAYVKEQTR